MKTSTHAVILAAGKGSRMGELPYQKSLLPSKSGKELLAYAMKSLYNSRFTKNTITTMVGHKKESVVDYVGNDTQFVIQEGLKGTGDAVRIFLNELPTNVSTLLVMNGDDSLSYRAEVLQKLLREHCNSHSTVSISVTNKYNPNVHTRAYIPGRDGELMGISNAQEASGEYLTGLCVLEIAYIKQVIGDLLLTTRNNAEFGITDFYKKALDDGKRVRLVENPHAALGINTREDWERSLL